MNQNQNVIINDLNKYFKMPIYYNQNKIELKKNIVSDLELVATVDPSCNSIYSFCFNNDNDVSKKITEQVAEYYTNDIHFLKIVKNLFKTIIQ